MDGGGGEVVLIECSMPVLSPAKGRRGSDRSTHISLGMSGGVTLYQQVREIIIIIIIIIVIANVHQNKITHAPLISNAYTPHTRTTPYIAPSLRRD